MTWTKTADKAIHVAQKYLGDDSEWDKGKAEEIRNWVRQNYKPGMSMGQSIHNVYLFPEGVTEEMVTGYPLEDGLVFDKDEILNWFQADEQVLKSCKKCGIATDKAYCGDCGTKIQ